MQKLPIASIKLAQAATKSIASIPLINIPFISLEPTDRAWLHVRIAERLQVMLQAGLVEEVKALRARGDLTIDMTSMRCVGYRQTWEMLDGTLPEKEFLDRCIFATRQLAKRQITWLRSMPERHMVACDQPQAAQAVLNLVNSWLIPR